MPVSGECDTPFQPNSEVVVLPKTMAPSSLQTRHHRRVLGRLVALVDQAALLGGHILGDRQVLDGDRHAVETADTVA